ncbi:extracellular matrix/biofilm biosynthesis regulator RemA family protein [Clostridium sp. BJN0001]|uniref:extracellular matrix regulator RemB n=1 Tax=Clostridium sp. BJN0001 TaxID=2930219 RepID=UPI001FD36CDB|nr:extracellular matrix/biofilm biosynthesis regulator RemA family protein [Clostridium sp. BJN0001]
MFLHLGENVVVSVKDIIGIFDLESSMYSSDTIQFLRMAEEDGFVEKVSEEKPKSFVVTEINKKSRIYFSPISSVTLIKRSMINYKNLNE